MFICVIQLSINRVSFLGSINKCQVEKHFRSKQSPKMFLFILKYVRIFYNFLSRNVHAFCQQSQTISWKNSCDIFILQAFATKNTCTYFFKWAHTRKAKQFASRQVVGRVRPGVLPQSSDFWVCAFISALPACLQPLRPNSRPKQQITVIEKVSINNIASD